MSRILFLLLVVLNAAVASWLYMQPPVLRVPPQSRLPGVDTLVLLEESEPQGSATAAELAGAPVPVVDAQNESCMTIGPFPTQADLRAAMNLLTPRVNRIQFREARATQSRGFWVYLPAQSTREAALSVARQLSAQGVRDYYVVTAGDQQNTISLGLFREQANALRRQSELRGMGFSAEIIARVEELPVYWIDLAASREPVLDWQGLLGTGSANLTAQPGNCM